MENKPQAGLGEYLRSEREKRHITIEQVASATKINVKLLHALESDNYDALPAKPFVRGFVASYTRYVGLDHREVLTRFESYLEEKSGKRYQRPEDSPHIFVEKEGQTENNKTALTVVMVGFIVVALLVFVVIKPSLKHKRSRAKKATVSNEEMVTVVPPPTDGAPALPVVKGEPSSAPAHSAKPSALPSPSPSAKPAVPSPSPAAPSPTTTAPSPKPSPAAAGDLGPVNLKVPPIPMNEVKHLLVVRAVEDSWIRYQIDDRPIMQFTLKLGQKIFLRARSSIRFSSGRPRGIEISFDNKEFQSFKTQPRLLVVPKEAEPQFKDQPFIAPNPSYLSTGNR
ncbi:MAG: RodZ domain-containing protein [Bdellovibrionota bacterium]